jgi:hypothetical protein
MTLKNCAALKGIFVSMGPGILGGNENGLWLLSALFHNIQFPAKLCLRIAHLEEIQTAWEIREPDRDC